MQVYFIENEYYFKRNFIFRDKNNKFFNDNDERSVFFNRGVIETVKKLGWAPGIVHLHGWMSALSALYIKTAFKDNPIFYDSKIVMSIYNDEFQEKFSNDFFKKIKVPDLDDNEIADIKENPDYLTLMKTCLKFVDGVILMEDNINPELINFIKKNNINYVQNKEDKTCEVFQKLYDIVCEEEEVCL
jgi:starch synthase